MQGLLVLVTECLLRQSKQIWHIISVVRHYLSVEKRIKRAQQKNYNKKWHQREGLPLKWIKNAGHNSNTDQPDEVNRLIEKFISEVDRRGVPDEIKYTVEKVLCGIALIWSVTC